MSEFDTWLTKKLQELNTDESVFLPYIISILEGEEESEEEKNEGLTGLLSDILDNEAAIEKTLNEILLKWKNCNGSDKVEDAANDVAKLDITEKMHQITQEKLANFTITKVEKTEEEKRLKEAILSGYGDVASGSSDEDEDDGKVDLGPGNSNAESVHKVVLAFYEMLILFSLYFQESLEMREKQREAAAAKKEKDKQDRTNQKNQAEERKKKAQEKAAKGERKSGR